MGFREKDAEKICIANGIPHLKHEHKYEVHESKLVPVISLKWLEKYRFDHQQEGKTRYSDYTDGWDAGHDAALRDCFLAAKKEAKKDA